MTLFLDDGDVRLYHGDVIEQLAGLPDGSVDCVVTSPPYWGLRDYGTDGQIGLEETPDMYVQRMVAVFREVRRVLAAHGTCWVNLGDSYNANQGAGFNGQVRQDHANRHTVMPRPPGLKPKDLVGIPWRVARALQEPYYTGRIKDERERIWLAATVEAEGCMYIHRRKAGQPNGQGYERKNDSYGAGLEVASTDRVVAERCLAITGVGSISEQTPEQNARRKQTIYRWNLRSNECRWVVRELYPHMIAKQHEARLLLGCPSSGDDARKAWESLKALHQGQSADIDFRPPEGMWEEGWFLRSDIIWAKCIPNPMPESVTDRPTKSHEYVFLLSKQPRYFFDQEAVRESAEWARWGDQTVPKHAGTETAAGWIKPKSKQELVGKRTYDGFNGRWDESVADGTAPTGRNVRSVWQIATQPYPEAHFATYPEELVRRCVLAGCPERVCVTCGKPSERIVQSHRNGSDWNANNRAGGDRMRVGQSASDSQPSDYTAPTTLGWSDCGHNTWRPGLVLDPFVGSGTTCKVARDHGRHSIGIDLSEDYLRLAAKRLQQLSLLTQETA